MGEQPEWLTVKVIYKDDKVRTVGSEYRLKIYREILEKLDMDKWAPGKPIQMLVVEFEGKKCLLIVPFS